ncbi:hypothetical protein NDU88_002459 [Pleurodeles waltl]|uniref:Secreted protein n=1 Tax=Pleurodeles waltl TaxID=8319 RepID=A0AAV7M0L5_PLEWA|nr:hypothetical protein NDU88_002459 [Pleurodeles waltl]
MAWAYFCWRDGGGLVIACFALPVGVADFCGCRVFGGLPVAGQNDRGGLPRPRRCYGGLLTCSKRLLPPSKALILTLAGGGGRPPKSRRQVTVPRSKDRGGNSDFPAGLAGGRLQTASQPSGKEASTMKPARNRAGGVEAVRRVQLHPSRISLSAQQTVKYM